MSDNKEKVTEKETIKYKYKFTKLIIGVGILIVVLVIGYFIKNAITGRSLKDDIIGEEGKVYTINRSTLEQVVKTSTLYTAEYPYNGYAAVKKGNGDVKYYVAYEGKVKAGIDVTKIEVSMDEETRVITIRLPQVVVEEPMVDAGTLEYIFVKDKYNTETVAQEAYKEAIADLSVRVQEDDSIVKSATETAKAAERAMVEPWVNQIDPDVQYEVVVLGFGEEAN